MTSGRERRGFERVEYAEGVRPLFIVGNLTLEVVDCAERGLRYAWAHNDAPPVGSDVRGVVRFPEGTEVPVEGVIVRAAPDGVAVNFTEHWIDKEVMERERRRLRGPGHYARDTG